MGMRNIKSNLLYLFFLGFMEVSFVASIVFDYISRSYGDLKSAYGDIDNCIKYGDYAGYSFYLMVVSFFIVFCTSFFDKNIGLSRWKIILLFIINLILLFLWIFFVDIAVK
jgi:hypothetical protein